MVQHPKISIGIDYGTRRVGIAVSDDTGTLAFPERVIPNSPALLDVVEGLCAEKEATTVVLGMSLTLAGEENPVQKEIARFAEALAARVSIPVVFEREYWTSQEARRVQGMTDMNDASAAALILQRYLDACG